MLFGKRDPEMRRVKNMNPVIFLPIVIAIIIALTACAPTKGSIVILENPDGTEFSMDFKDWSEKNKCELSLKKDDELQIEISREDGEVAMTISGKNGSEPYTGNDLQSSVFTVTVSETDEYTFEITGYNATGKVKVKNLGSR